MEGENPMTTRIAFFDVKPYDRESFDRANEPFGFDLSYFEARLSATTAPLAAGHEVVCAFVQDTLDKPVLDALVAEGVKLIALRSAGYNNVDLAAAFGRIPIVRVPAYSPHGVAEHAAALLLTLNRKTHKAYSRTRESNFSINGLMGFDLFGKTAGVVGTGRIGRAFISIMKGFGMKVLAFDPVPDPGYAKTEDISYVPLDALYAKSNVIALHCPLTPETRHMIGVQALAKMKKGVVIINTGRGLLIDTKALIQGLKSGKVGAAGLDVYEEEEKYFFEDFSASSIADDVLARLLTFPNVLVTSHQGFFTREAVAAIAETTLANIREFFDGGGLKNEICYQCNAGCPKKEGRRCFALQPPPEKK
jgi:D-lactate dehydrogenase